MGKIRNWGIKCSSFSSRIINDITKPGKTDDRIQNIARICNLKAFKTGTYGS
jgi:hypothetical protein